MRTATRESPSEAMKTQHSQKQIHKNKKNKKSITQKILEAEKQHGSCSQSWGWKSSGSKADHTQTGATGKGFQWPWTDSPEI